jgi:hypothetical protein
MFADTDTSRSKGHLSNFVKLVDIIDVVHDGELIVAVELVDVLNHFSSRVLGIAMAAQSDKLHMFMVLEQSRVLTDR